MTEEEKLIKKRADHQARKRANPERNRAEVSRWVRRYPLKKKARTLRNKMQRLGAPGTGITVEQLTLLFAEANGICAYCEKIVETLTLDHVHPIHHGGHNSIDNVKLCCQPCNSSKGTKILYKEWIPPKERKV